MTVCGEIAGDPTFLPILIGLGVDELSMGSPMIPEIKYVLGRMSTTEAEALVKEIIDSPNSASTVERLKEFLAATMSEAD